MATENERMIQIVTSHIGNNNTISFIEAMEHLASCDHCANEFADAVSKDTMMKAPHYIKANILEQTKDIQFNDRKKLNQKTHYSKQVQLITYSLKVGLAMCGCLAILFLSNGTQDTKNSMNPFHSSWTNDVKTNKDIKDKNSKNTSFIYKMNNSLRDFSNDVAEYAGTLVTNNKNLEEIDDDQKEK